MKVNYNSKSSIEKIEDSLLMKILEDALDKMSNQELKDLSVSLGVKNIDTITPQVMTGVFQAIFRAGGFKSYQLTVIIVNAVLKALIGRGLSFGGNIILTRTMSILMGPIGWIITGLWAAIDITGPAYRVTIPAVIQVAALRKKHLYSKYDKKITNITLSDENSGDVESQYTNNENTNLSNSSFAGDTDSITVKTNDKYKVHNDAKEINEMSKVVKLDQFDIKILEFLEENQHLAHGCSIGSVGEAIGCFYVDTSLKLENLYKLCLVSRTRNGQSYSYCINSTGKEYIHIHDEDHVEILEYLKENKHKKKGYSEETISFGSLDAEEGLSPSLKSVTISGEVNGMAFKSSIRQEYKNETNKTLEIIYTFPLAWGTTLLGLYAEISDKRLEGVVVEKKMAEKKYEESLAEGDTPVMVQQSARGLCTANLGNIKSGESVVVEINCARLLRFEQGRIRLCIPTVIGERYGDSHTSGGLAPHESVKVNATTSYPLSLSLRLLGEVAKGGISCPTHPIIASSIDNGLNITLVEGALLDRDFVLLMEGIKSQCLAQCVPGAEENLVLASFAPCVHRQDFAPLAIKILVDCSGSMGGPRIQQAKQGLQQVLKELRPDDRTSYSCFGSEVRHLAGELRPNSPVVLEDLASKIAKTDANMGGTNMEDALTSTFNDITLPQGHDFPPSVLLITDGDVWDIKGIVKTAKTSGHRIFAIGVGSAPGESLLNDMAEQTGGACELVTHNENMPKAIMRMFHRMRGSTAQNLEIDWGFKPLWQSVLPKFIYDGETIHCYAIAANKPKSIPILSWKIRRETHSAQAEQLEFISDADILRLGKTRQLEETDSSTERLKIALEHQLISENSSLFLVYVREGEDKLEGLPTMQHIKQMPAYGHGCWGGASAAAAYSCFLRNDEDCSVPVFLRIPTRQKTPPIQADVLDDLQINLLLRLWQQASYTVTSFQEGLDMVLKVQGFEELAQCLEEIGDELGLSIEQMWAAFIHWALETTQNGRFIERHEQRLINTVLPSISQAMLTEARLRFKGRAGHK